MFKLLQVFGFLFLVACKAGNCGGNFKNLVGFKC